jgi:hypothetical protein
MNVPAAVEGGVVGIPVLPFADACVDEMETCAIVFRCQCKGDRGGARLKVGIGYSFPSIPITPMLSDFGRSVRMPVRFKAVTQRAYSLSTGNTCSD